MIRPPAYHASTTLAGISVSSIHHRCPILMFPESTARAAQDGQSAGVRGRSAPLRFTPEAKT